MNNDLLKKDRVFQVSEFNEFIYKYLGKVGEVVVEGEISQINVSQGMWLFLTIKDENASVAVFGVLNRIKNHSVLEQGMMVRVYGACSIHRKTGKFSLTANQIVPAGEGALQIAFEKLKLKLKKEGLFSEDRKRPLPPFPEKIGLITAENSEAYTDFIKVLAARMGGIKIYFYPVKVQGRDSVSSILKAFKFFNKNPADLDLLVLTRGGGSLEDLMSFNDEQIARAVFSSKIPVVCGIGHEKNASLADFTADLRASTPSNAAELIVKHRKDLLRQTSYSLNIMEAKLNQQVDSFKEFKHFIDKIESRIRLEIRQKDQIVNTAIHALKDAVKNNIESLRSLIYRFFQEFSKFNQKLNFLEQDVVGLKIQLVKDTEIWFKKHQTDFNSLFRLLKSLDYRKVLKRGFSITADSKGKIIKLTSQVSKNKNITTKVFNGKIYSKVFSMEVNKND
jgi:exodeoxyribonuclease VII large subunit